ncbi:MAG: filamentous hemagglutinin N-terminal domain-containing protein [Burkholderiales bacterium]|nr:filamentous hemagglutinin N-terminal domain-containing protein [Burkholderiales bacterium]
MRRARRLLRTSAGTDQRRSGAAAGADHVQGTVQGRAPCRLRHRLQSGRRRIPSRRRRGGGRRGVPAAAAGRAGAAVRCPGDLRPGELRHQRQHAGRDDAQRRRRQPLGDRLAELFHPGGKRHPLRPALGSLSINRVVGPDPSAIYGALSSNGRLVLVNPAGIAVGQGGVVDTAGFTASTLRMSDADAIAGRLAFGGSGAAGPLQVDGTIVARSGDVVLIAPSIQTGSQAIVQAEGATILAAGQRVDITGRGLEGIHLEVQAGDQAVNLGTLKGDAVGIFADTLKHSGAIQAQAVSTEGGKVVLRAFGGDNLVSGSITAAAADGQGGSIDVLGRRVGLLAGASLDASGPAGGGAIRVGGDYQGKNPSVPNAQATYVDANASLRADATGQGDGGRVIVWSDGATRMNGKISARGGPQGGGGGFAEVSGKQYLAFKGTADLRAPAGKVGTLLLDPNDVIIDATSTTDTTTANGPLFEGGNGTSHILDADLNAQLALASVVVTTNSNVTPDPGSAGDITVASGANIQWTAPTTLGLKADNNIVLQGNITATDPGAAVAMQAGGSISQASSGSVITAPALGVAANNGSISLVGANLVDTLTGSAAGSGNDFTFRNAKGLSIGSLYLSNAVFTISGAGISANDGTNAGAVDVRTSSGNLNLDTFTGVAGGSVRLQAAGDLAVGNGAAVNGSTGLVKLLAGGNLSVGTQVPSDGSESTILSAAGQLTLQGQGVQTSLPVGNTSTWPSSVTLTSGTGIQVTSTVGDVDFGASTTVSSLGAPIPINVDAKGSVLGAGSFNSGGDPGVSPAVGLKAGGSISFGWMNSTFYQAESGSTYAPGGDILLQAGGDISGSGIYTYGGNRYGGPAGPGGNVTANAGGAVNIGYIATSGGYAYEDTSLVPPVASGAGGQAGAVTLTAGTGITTGSIDSTGGSAYGGTFSAGAGGSGGNVTLNTATGDVTLMGTVSANGGSGTPGGSGGAVSITAGGNVVLSPYQGSLAVTADGGSSDAGVGGQGGSVSVRTGSGIIVSPQLGEATVLYDPSSGFSANGGTGGTDSGSGDGLAGGKGGSIVVQGSGSQLVLDSTLILRADGGGGGAADMSTGTNVGGQGGAGGAIQAIGNGTVNLRTPAVSAAGGGGGVNGDDTTYAADGALGSFSASGTAVEVESNFTPVANWNNASVVNVRGASVVSTPGVLQNTGTLNLFDTAFLAPTTLVNTGTLNAVGSDVSAPTLTGNAGKLTVAAGSILDAPQFLDNTGTLQVDGTLRIGTVTPSGTTTTTQIAAAVAPGTVFTNQASGVLSGSGTLAVDSGAGTVDNFGTLSPGGAGTVGTLTLNAGLVMEPGSVYAADILSTATHDTVLVSGSLVSGGSYVINYVGGPVFNAGDVLRMIQSAALDATTLPTSDRPELASAANGNDAVLVANVTLPTPVPPPPPDQQQALQQSNNQVTTFAQLFVQMSDQQQEQDKQDNRIGKDDIVVTDTACTR